MGFFEVDRGDRAHLDNSLIDRVIADKFRLSECIGAGSYGAVYKANQVSLGRTVAVKILRPELADDPRVVRRFHDEALAASRLNHPNTVAIIDYGQTSDGLLFLVMEYLRGRTLTELIHSDPPRRADQIVDLMSQLLSGLEEAHAAGVVHADLKSDNVVVEERRDNWRLVKVVDFGVSRILDIPREDEDGHTIWGTPEYMAPEVIEGGAPSVSSDLYAAGVILYELLTGVTPFADQASTMDILAGHLRDDPLRPSIRRPDVTISRPIEELALRALAKQPGERFPNAADFRKALRSLHDQQLDETGERARCASCGASSPASFRFCPDCGRPRAQEPAGPEPTAGLTAPSSADEDTSGVFPLPLVGRRAEAGKLLAFITSEGAPRLLQLVGSPGSGKSRLLGEVCRPASTDDADWTIHFAHSDPTGLARPLYPIRAMVATLLDVPRACPLAELESALKATGLSQRDLPGMAELFGHQGDLWQLEPPIRKRELQASTVRVLRSVAEKRPAVLVFEDVDRFDRPSQELLTRLTENDDTHNLRVVVSNGPGFAERWPPSVARVDLGILGDDALGALSDHLRKHASDIMPDQAALATCTDRLPDCVVQLARFILEGGSVESAPSSIADLIAARIELLPRSALLVCQAVAILGRETTRALLAHVAREQLDPERIDAALALLRARGFLAYDTSTVGFERDLIRTVVYEAIPADVRRELHNAALRALRGTGADPSTLGNHHDRARHPIEAADLLARAGDDAVYRFDDVGACALYQRALMAARSSLLEQADEHAHVPFVTISVKLSDALRVHGELGLARGVVEEAKGHCQGTAVLEAQLLRADAHLSLTEGDVETAIATVRHAIGLAIPTGQTDTLSDLYLDLSSMYLRNGQPNMARSELEEGLDLATMGEGAAAEHGPQALWRILLRLAQLYESQGEPSKARTLATAALRHARRTHSRMGAARVQAALADMYSKDGNAVKAERYRQAAIDEMRKLGDRRGTAELLLAGSGPTRSLLRITSASLNEARELSAEVGWSEGVRRTKPIID